MPAWHLHELEHALTQRGWITRDLHEPLEARGFGHSATWEVNRGDRRLLLDFDGGDGDGLTTHPIERAYGCHVREHKDVTLYFYEQASPRWSEALASFLASFDALNPP